MQRVLEALETGEVQLRVANGDYFCDAVAGKLVDGYDLLVVYALVTRYVPHALAHVRPDEDQLDGVDKPAVWYPGEAEEPVLAGHEVCFFGEAERLLSKLLPVLGLTLGRWTPPGRDAAGVAIYLRASPLSRGQVNQLLLDLEDVFAVRGVFAFGVLAERLVPACGAVVVKYCEEHVDELVERLSKVEVRKTVPSGEAFMIPFETSFQANMGQSEIAVPDPDVLPDEYVECMMEKYAKPTRGSFVPSFVLAFFNAIAHETVHCVQHICKQEDSDSLSWSAEHDASYAAESIIAQVARLPDLADILKPGLAEAAAMISREQAWTHYCRWDESVRAEYRAWRDAVGCKAPSAAISEDSTLVGQFKCVVSAESRLGTEEGVAAQLEMLFKGRTGNVYECASWSPPDALIAPARFRAEPPSAAP